MDAFAFQTTIRGRRSSESVEYVVTVIRRRDERALVTIRASDSADPLSSDVDPFGDAEGAFERLRMDIEAALDAGRDPGITLDEVDQAESAFAGCAPDLGDDALDRIAQAEEQSAAPVQDSAG
jgi:hypothetical protein